MTARCAGNERREARGIPHFNSLDSYLLNLRSKGEVAYGTVLRVLSQRPCYLPRAQAYKYFKQATVGDVDTQRPSVMDPGACAKWDAWASVKGTTEVGAMERYCAAVRAQRDKYGDDDSVDGDAVAAAPSGELMTGEMEAERDDVPAGTTDDGSAATAAVDLQTAADADAAADAAADADRAPSIATVIEPATGIAFAVEAKPPEAASTLELAGAGVLA